MFFWNSLAFLVIQRILPIWSLVPLPFSLCRMPHLNNKQNKNTNPIISRQDYHRTQPWPSEENQTNKNSAQISMHTKLAQTTGPKFSSFSSFAQSCPTLCDPMDCSMPGLPVHHQVPKFTQAHVHWVGGAIQPFHPLLSLDSILKSRYITLLTNSV